MKTKFLILIISFCWSICLAQKNSTPDFSFGNTCYYNLNIGETITFLDGDVTLLQVKNHYNQLRIANDTVWLKVSRRTLPQINGGLRMFVADNKNIKALDVDTSAHSQLTKDILLCLSDARKSMLEPNSYIFPVNFYDGFLWSAEEDSYMFSYQYREMPGEPKAPFSYPGMGFDMQDARGKDRHLITAFENSKVIWVKDKSIDKEGKQASILLQSESEPGIYYLYEHLYNRSVEVKEGHKLVRGDVIGTIWGDDSWGNLQFVVLRSDSVPSFEKRFSNVINIFPQLYELYFSQSFNYQRNYTKGRILFGLEAWLNGNKKNASAFESYIGKGWLLGQWNTTDKVEWISKNEHGNIRLKKTLFVGTNAECENPDDYYDYQINVINGTYRLRAKVGDIVDASWQKIAFNGVDAGTFSMEGGVREWTPERIVNVTDGKLMVRIFVDSESNKPAGLSEIVFQQAY